MLRGRIVRLRAHLEEVQAAGAGNEPIIGSRADQEADKDDEEAHVLQPHPPHPLLVNGEGREIVSDLHPKPAQH